MKVQNNTHTERKSAFLLQGIKAGRDLPPSEAQIPSTLTFQSDLGSLITSFLGYFYHISSTNSLELIFFCVGLNFVSLWFPYLLVLALLIRATEDFLDALLYESLSKVQRHRPNHNLGLSSLGFNYILNKGWQLLYPLCRHRPKHS